MNTTNTPDRDEVIAKVSQMVKTGSFGGINLLSGEKQLLEAALTLLDRDREDGKRLDWLETEGFQGSYTKVWATNHLTLREGIDSAMATSTEKGES